MPILGNLFNNPQASTTYDNFQTLTLKIEKLLDDKSVVKTDVMFFEMGEDYTLIGFDSDDEVIESPANSLQIYDAETGEPVAENDGGGAAQFFNYKKPRFLI